MENYGVVEVFEILPHNRTCVRIIIKRLDQPDFINWTVGTVILTPLTPFKRIAYHLLAPWVRVPMFVQIISSQFGFGFIMPVAWY